jgi:hypothetical protein
LIVTEVISDGTVLGYYLWGPSTKLSWVKNEPAGYIDIAGKIADGVLRFKSGTVPMEAKFSGPNAMTLQSTNPAKRSETATIKFAPLWQLVPASRPAISKR